MYNEQIDTEIDIEIDTEIDTEIDRQRESEVLDHLASAENGDGESLRGPNPVEGLIKEVWWTDRKQHRLIKPDPS